MDTINSVPRVSLICYFIVELIKRCCYCNVLRLNRMMKTYDTYLQKTTFSRNYVSHLINNLRFYNFHPLYCVLIIFFQKQLSLFKVFVLKILCAQIINLYLYAYTQLLYVYLLGKCFYKLRKK